MRNDILQINRAGLDVIITKLRKLQRGVDRGFVGKELQCSLATTADGRHIILAVKNPTVERAEAKVAAEKGVK